MDVCDIRVIHTVLARHGFRFSKMKGQNFLTAAWVPERMTAEAGIDARHGVLEVGPGFGALTKSLCEKAGRVLALELDRSLLPVLGETLGAPDNLTVIQGDICRADVRGLVDGHLAGLVPAAVANLPYSVTTQALTALLEVGVFSSVTVMVQREFARRMAAGPGTEAYGAFSLYCQVKADARVLFDVPPDCFTPRPKVTSSVVRLVPFRVPPVPEEEQPRFLKVVRAAFSQRRKTLCNALCAAYPLPKEEMASLLRGCGVDPAARGETLGVDAFLSLSRALYDGRS